PAAYTIYTNLKNGTTSNTVCNGHQWIIGTCNGGIELSVDVGAGCTCAVGSGFTLRPCGNAMNWGGVRTPTCNGPTQTMTLVTDNATWTDTLNSRMSSTRAQCLVG